jgi:hypothetical protein
MTDFIPAAAQFIRTANNMVVTTDGAGGYLVDGASGNFRDVAELAKMGIDLPADAIGGLIVWSAGRNIIMITAAHHAIGATDRKLKAAHTAQFIKARAFFDGMNEGGEGYNPYRS